jgi:hypothetical protein
MAEDRVRVILGILGIPVAGMGVFAVLISLTGSTDWIGLAIGGLLFLLGVALIASGLTAEAEERARVRGLEQEVARLRAARLPPVASTAGGAPPPFPPPT